MEFLGVTEWQPWYAVSCCNVAFLYYMLAHYLPPF